MSIADTGVIVALIDKDDRHHKTLLDLFSEDPVRWLLPWAILPDVDYLVAKYLGNATERVFVSDLSRSLYRVDWGADSDLDRADELIRQYRDLNLGLVDTIVMAMAERTKGRVHRNARRTSLRRRDAPRYASTASARSLAA